MVDFREINEDNFEAVVSMELPPEQNFLAPNVKSLAQAWLYRENGDVFPFAVYGDDALVGFMLLDADFEEKVLYIWRFMIDPAHQGRGYGTQAVGKVVVLARESGKFQKAIVDYAPGNGRAAHVYEKVGFRETGEISNGEIVMELMF